MSRDQYAAAILGVRGREPTIDELCETLGVSKATFYNHIPGYEALVGLAGDIICDAILIPDATVGMHWSQWCLQFAETLKKTLEDYPIFLKQMSPRPGQMALLERVLQRLTKLGLDPSTALYTFYAVTSVITGAANSEKTGQLGSRYQDVAPSFSNAVESAPLDTPLLHSLMSGGYSFSSAAMYDDILLFTLEGIARQRGEELPELGNN